ncbi:MAG TPA: hypothetical protein DCQ43_00460 [Treponema sp.]|nr:hypothetical protein [Treponema sp.]
MKKLALCVLIAFGCVLGLSAKETTLQRRNVTSAALQKIIENDYVNSTEIDEDGDLFIDYDGINGYAIVISDMSLIRFLSGWTAVSGLSESDAIALCNQWNSDKIFAYAYYIDGKFRLDYYMPFEGGLSSTNFNTAMEMFFELAGMFWDFLEENEAL